MLGFWKMIPMLRRTAFASRSRSWPAIVTVAARLGQRRRQDRDRRRLAGAVRAEEGEQLARPDVEADVIDGRDVGLLVALGQVLDGDHGVHGGPRVAGAGRVAVGTLFPFRQHCTHRVSSASMPLRPKPPGTRRAPLDRRGDAPHASDTQRQNARPDARRRCATASTSCRVGLRHAAEPRRSSGTVSRRATPRHDGRSTGSSRRLSRSPMRTGLEALSMRRLASQPWDGHDVLCTATS